MLAANWQRPRHGRPVVVRAVHSSRSSCQASQNNGGCPVQNNLSQFVARDQIFVEIRGAESIDLTKLADELATLRAQMWKESEGKSEMIQATAAIASAEEAARASDRSSVLQHLKKAGQWALDIASRVGTNLVSAALKKVLVD